MPDQNAPPQPEPSSAKAPLLPIWATINAVIHLTWDNGIEYLKIIWCWMLVALPIMCLYSWFVWPYMDSSSCPDRILNNFDLIFYHPYRTLLIRTPIELFRLFFGASIAVAWHRLILRNEKTSGAVYLRFDRTVWNYFIFAVCLWLPFLLHGFIVVSTKVPFLMFPVIEAKTLLNAHSAPVLITSAMLLLSYISYIAVAFILCFRYSVILPASALELKDVTPKAVWKITSRNFWRLFWGSQLALIPAIMFSLWQSMLDASYLEASCSFNIAGPIIYSVDYLLTIAIFLPFELTFLSLAYQFFFEREKYTATIAAMPGWLENRKPRPKLFTRKTLCELLILVVFFCISNAGDTMLANTKKETAQCNDATHADAAINACTDLLNKGNSNPYIFDYRAAAYTEEDKTDLAIEDLKRFIKLSPRDLIFSVVFGEPYFERGQYSKALHDLDSPAALYMLKADKEAWIYRATLFWERGISKFYTTSSSSAVDDLTNAVKEAPADAYKVIWLHIAHMRAGQNDQQEFSRNNASLPQDKWPAPIIAFYQGKISYDELYEKAKTGDAKAQQGQICEANFYSGELYLQKNMKDEAVKVFQAVDKNCPADFIEIGTAHAELKNLESEPAPTP